MKTVKLLYLANNDIAIPLFDWLTKQAEVVLWKEKLSVADIATIQPDLVVSYSYRYIITYDVLSCLPNRFINLHIAYLPYNRGADPNAWSILEETPKGVSIHITDPGIDTGPILVQKEIALDETHHTLGSSYNALQNEIQRLFKDNWDGLSNGSIRAVPQIGQGTYHVTKQFNAIKNALMGGEGWDVSIPIFKERYQTYMMSNKLL